MNARQRRRMESKRLLSSRFNNKENVIKLNRNNTLEHELCKFLLAWEQFSLGKDVVTEAIFCNGKRADIFVLDDCEALEVLHSESYNDFRKKLDDYPCEVIPFKTADVLSSYNEQLFDATLKGGYSD